MRRPLGLAVLLLCLVCVACGRAPSTALTQWQLLVPGQAARAVVLPGRLPLPERPLKYALSADVALPPAMRGAPVSVAVADTLALGVLRVDGTPALSCVEPTFERYRSNGAACWSFVAPDAATMRLDLEVDHTTPLSAVFSAAPELVAAPGGGPRLRGIVLFDDVTALATVFGGGVVGVMYLLAYLFDRARRAHLWFALEALGGMAYPLWWCGVTQPLFGIADRCVLVESMLVAGLASLHFTHAQLGLGPVPRAWRYVVAAGAVLGLAQLAPFPPAVLPNLAAVAIGLPTAAQVFLCARAMRRPGERATAATIGLTWLAIAVAAPFEVPCLVGGPSHEGGVRVMTLGIAAVAIGQGALLARQHVTSLRDADRLNAELRRQIAERSRQLADALTQLASGKAGGDALHEGQIVADRYRVTRLLGAGGMGEVYEVERLEDGRRLALKLLHGAATRDDLARLAREAQIAAKIAHPNLVSIADIDVTTGHGLFLVMELVEGGSLADRRERYGNVPWGLRVLRQVAQGLTALHAAGIVHRDLKPANVLLSGREDVAKISDFGIASLDDAAALGAADTVSARSGDTERAAGLTRTGMILGTPQYMAPELARGSRLATAAVDVFALGVLAYEVLGAGYPFVAPPILDAIYGRAMVRRRSLAAIPGLDASLATLLDACLGADPAQRPTARALVDALSAFE